MRIKNHDCISSNHKLQIILFFMVYFCNVELSQNKDSIAIKGVFKIQPLGFFIYHPKISVEHTLKKYPKISLEHSLFAAIDLLLTHNNFDLYSSWGLQEDLRYYFADKTTKTYLKNKALTGTYFSGGLVIGGGGPTNLKGNDDPFSLLLGIKSLAGQQFVHQTKRDRLAVLDINAGLGLNVFINNPHITYSYKIYLSLAFGLGGLISIVLRFIARYFHN